MVSGTRRNEVGQEFTGLVEVSCNVRQQVVGEQIVCENDG